MRNDSPVVQQWQQKFLETVFFPTLDKHEIKTVLHGGDYGDRRKYVNFATARFIEDHYRQPLRQRGITEHVIIGNHDCFLRDSTEINSVDELYRHDTSMHIYTQPTELDVEGTGVLLLPWICGNNREATEQLLTTSSCPIVLGHLELTGFQMYRGVPQHDGMDPNVLARFSRVLSGHFHHRSQNHNITYVGAPYAMVWSDYPDPRGFCILDTKTHDIEFIDNPYTMFARIVYDDANKPATYFETLMEDIAAQGCQDAYVKLIVKNRTQPHHFDMVMTALSKLNVQDVLVVDDIMLSDTEGEPETLSVDIDTLTLMDEYVEGLTVSCDKLALQEYLRSIYREAASVASARVH